MNQRYLLVMLVVCLLVGCVQALGVDMGAWGFRKEITFTNTGANLTNYQIMFTVNRSSGSDSGSTVYLDGKCESDYDDIRFTTSDGNTLCDYWIESSSSTVATIWVEIPSIVNSTAYGSTKGYLYYKNTGASAASNGTNTFQFFDDFLGGSLNTDIWSDTKSDGTITVSSGRLSISGNIGAKKGIESKNTFGSNTIIEAMMTGTSTASAGYLNFGYGWYGDNYQSCYLDASDGTVDLWLYSKDTSVQGTSVGAQYTSDKLIKLERRGDNSQVATYGAYGSVSHNRAISSSQKVCIGMWYSGNTATYSFDWIFVRKYTATEPTVSAWGSEEDPTPRYITVDFSGVPTSGYVPLTVYFTDASVGYNVTTDTWSWSFGDTSPNSTSQNPAHTYTTSGLYTVGLTATNTSFAKTNTTTKVAYINATVNLDAPIADFTVTETCGDIGDTFYFIDFSTGGGLYAWNWSFGDGQYSELRNPTHQYSSNGTFDVGLTVWGAYGNDTLTRSNLFTIPCGAPTPTPTPTVTATPTPTYVYGNISMYRVEPNYIIWSVTENITSVVIDGYEVLVSGGYYGQYANVSPGTKHFACVNGNECISVVTPDDGISVLGNWIIYLVLIVSCIVCTRVPITCVFPVVMGVYLINVHFPSIGAPFEEYLLCAVLMIMGIISAIIGFTRR